MLDIIVIGRPGYKSTDLPRVVYCGDSRSEAKKAAALVSDKFQWIYEVNGMIRQNYKRAHSPAPIVTVDTAVVAPVQAEQPKESRKNTKTK
jgi:hypothetical protein